MNPTVRSILVSLRTLKVDRGWNVIKYSSMKYHSSFTAFRAVQSNGSKEFKKLFYGGRELQKLMVLFKSGRLRQLPLFSRSRD